MRYSKFVYLILFIFLTNLVLAISIYFDFIPQIYFLGVRLNLFLFINLLLIYFSVRDSSDHFLEPLKKFGQFKFWFVALIIPLAIIGINLTLGFITNKIKILKPDYFYEFGMSSIFDFPIYFIWNFFFLVSLEYLWRIIFSASTLLKQSLFSLCFMVSFIGAFAVDYSAKYLTNYLSIIVFVFSISLYQYSIFNWSRSLWVSTFSLFTLIWSYILAFGSNNQFLIKAFFARNYDSWDGLIYIHLIKNIPNELFISIIIIVFSIILHLSSKRKIDSIIN